ncbi:MAG: hypothetical protein PHX74_12420 [Candidatus Sumerlaeales bacterium]|nr:hypothetical protein [Candidatus Sumerlaeales bacterium]
MTQEQREEPLQDKSIPIKPWLDYWAECDCGAEPEFYECGGFAPEVDGITLWVGPSFCPECGQAFDLSDLNIFPAAAR